jgi:glyoxylase-like metal-dependent hydrolase (beta-lactamase superfamily II)
MDVEQIAPHLWHWTAPHPDWKPEHAEGGQGWDEVVSSYALVADDELILIDPLVPTDPAEAERFWSALDLDAEEHGPPAIVITIYWHARSAKEIGERYDGATVWSPAHATEELGKRVAYTHTYTAGEGELPAGIRAYDTARLGEMVLYLPSHKAIVFGDTVLDGPRLLPDSWLRNDMSKQDVAEALRPLLDENVELLLLTHGGPVRNDARGQLERLLRV